MDYVNKILCGDVFEQLKQLPDQSVHCVVTSPPYYGLRDYKIKGQIGLESSIEEFIQKIVQAFSEVKRVLRNDGTLWLNFGDSYVTSPPGNKTPPKDRDGAYQRRQKRQVGHGEDINAIYNKRKGKLPPKNLIGMPWRIALALQADGWILRQDIIWHKPNPMPESVFDRCMNSHEYIFLLTKNSRYYFDAYAIREPQTGNAHSKGTKLQPPKTQDFGLGIKNNKSFLEATSRWGDSPDGKRNKRSVWTVPIKAYKDAHFATFPPDLIRPCILAGTSEKGCCARCGKPYERQEERTNEDGDKVVVLASSRYSYIGDKPLIGQNAYEANELVRGSFNAKKGLIKRKTIGWVQTCECNLPSNGYDACTTVVPCVVLDPFIGSGTTAAVAKEQGRNYVGIELNPEYIQMAEKRINETFYDALRLETMNKFSKTLAYLAKTEKGPFGV